MLQNLIVIGVNQLFHWKSGSFIVSDNIVNNIGNFKGIVKASLSTVVDMDGKFDVMGGPACSCNKSSNDIEWFVFGWFII